MLDAMIFAISTWIVDVNFRQCKIWSVKTISLEALNKPLDGLGIQKLEMIIKTYY